MFCYCKTLAGTSLIQVQFKCVIFECRHLKKNELQKKKYTVEWFKVKMKLAQSSGGMQEQHYVGTLHHRATYTDILLQSLLTLKYIH